MLRLRGVQGSRMEGRAVSDHLPECVDAMIPDFHNERWVCICAALSSCEERVRKDQTDRCVAAFYDRLFCAPDAIDALREEKL